MDRYPVRSLVVLLTVLVLTAAGCSAAPAAAPTARGAAGFERVTVDQLARMLEDKDFVLVNTHAPYEGEIPGTDLFIPFDEIAGRQDELPARDARIVLYCRSSSMSLEAAETLVDLGYTHVIEVEGGMTAWRAAGHALSPQ